MLESASLTEALLPDVSLCLCNSHIICWTRTASAPARPLTCFQATLQFLSSLHTDAAAVRIERNEGANELVD